jgi:hypothetical protein
MEDSFVVDAKKAGYTDKEIQSYLEKKTAPPKEPRIEPKEPIVEPSVEEATDLASAYSNINDRWLPSVKRIAGALFNPKQVEEAQKDIQKLNVGLITALRERGINAYLNPELDVLMMEDDEGVHHEIEPGIFKTLIAGKSEIIGGISGAIMGATRGAKAGATLALVAGQAGPQIATPEEILTVPLGAIAGGFVGGLVGGFVGSSGGAGLDYLTNSYKLKNDLDAKVAMSKMVDAGISDATMTVLLGGMWKVAKPLASYTVKTIGKAFDVFKKSGQKVAYEILIKDMNISKVQASDIVSKWLRLADNTKSLKIKGTFGKKRNMTYKEVSVKAIMETQQGSEHIISASKGNLGQLTRAIDDRAKDIISASVKLAPDAPGETVRHALQDYQVNVGEYWEAVKGLATDIIDKAGYKSDVPVVKVEGTMKEILSHVYEPLETDYVKNVAQHVSTLKEAGNFSTMLDLRQIINTTKNKVSSRPAQALLKRSIKSLDREINKVARKHLNPSQAKLWIKQFRDAKVAYTKMKNLEKNVLFKSIVKKQGVTEDQVVKRLLDFTPALDDTFIDVMHALPKDKIPTVEGAAIQILTQKHTIGLGTELQAVHFPELANKLAKYNFKTPASKNYVSMINEFADVFKNDVHLGKTFGSIQLPKSQSYLTVDPIIRAKYEFASGIFNYVKRLLPGEKSARLTLVKLVENVLDNPLKAKTAKTFIRKFPKAQKSEANEMVKNLQTAWAKAGGNTLESKESLKLHKATKAKKVPKTSGGFGSGYYLQETIENSKGTQAVLRREVNPSELATIKDISTVMGREVSPDEIRKLKTLPSKLKKAGYKGISNDGRVMLFDSPE